MKTNRLYDKMNKDNKSEISISLQDSEHLKELLQTYSLNEPVPAKIIPKYSLNSWMLFLGYKGVFQLPTIELIDFINHLISGRSAIEICCGIGTIAKSLNIPATDRKLSEGTGNEFHDYILKKEENEFNKYAYNFPDFVEKLTAYRAIEKYKPEVVIGCWVTEKARGRKIGSGYGVEEDKILDRVGTYIHCGNSANPLHSKKYIRKFKHWTIEADWLLDKASLRGPSQIKIWTAEEPNWDAFPENLEFDIL